MPRSFTIVLTVAAGLSLVSCASKHELGGKPTHSASAARDTETMDDQYEAPPPRDTVPMVMEAKLAHAQAVLEGIALANYAQIEANAMALKRISEGGDWLVHDSATYFDFSAEFRRICDDLASHARAQNVRATVSDYANLTNSCVACHEFLRMERQTKDMPGRMSMRHGWEVLTE